MLEPHTIEYTLMTIESRTPIGGGLVYLHAVNGASVEYLSASTKIQLSNEFEPDPYVDRTSE